MVCSISIKIFFGQSILPYSTFFVNYYSDFSLQNDFFHPDKVFPPYYFSSLICYVQRVISVISSNNFDNIRMDLKEIGW